MHYNRSLNLYDDQNTRGTVVFTCTPKSMLDMSIPILRNALYLWCNDRPLFYRRLKGHASRLPDILLSCLPGRTSPYRDFFKPVLFGDDRPRWLSVFCSNPFAPSGIGTSLRAQGRLLRDMGYAVDGIFYVQDDLSRASRTNILEFFDRAAIVFPRSSRLERLQDGVTATNLDDWCGNELREACARMFGAGSYAGIIVHQPWLSPLLESAPEGVLRCLFMHDNFADRAALFEAQGLPRRLAWLSVDEDVQSRCLRRADVVFAVQEEDQKAFRRQASGVAEVVLLKIPLADKTSTPLPPWQGTLHVGIVASDNVNNRPAVEDFVGKWSQAQELRNRAVLSIAGDVGFFIRSVDPSVRVLGRVDNLDAFYAQSHIAVNPDCGGTGIKVKSLEALSYGRPLLCSTVGSRGLGSALPWHTLADRAAMINALQEVLAVPDSLVSMRAESIDCFRRYCRMDAYLDVFRRERN